ncbi:hypothetical protein GNZ12_24105 [Paraburkholderia sp. 1N]|uniref:Avidin family protein n=1 Tax=Paraburkholderia solitsugae TaxID=2675748 RepID=A0ABX2BXP2_9BURK|nr:hypothetical protein [Paraburkholderia solitsugae]NPT44337.1 hypothetical protein [Paraburkholderia solitsugae]
MKRIAIATLLALAAMSAHAGILATDGFQAGSTTVQIALTDTQCKGGPKPYQDSIPVSGVATIMSSGGHKAVGCWNSPAGGQEIEIAWADGAVGRYPVLDMTPTAYGSAHGM